MSFAQPNCRLDGFAKITGAAHFGADFPVRDIAYGVLILSTISRGHITRMSTERAREIPGVLKVVTPDNAMRLPNGGQHPELKAAPAVALLQDHVIRHNGQAIGVVVAESLEIARYAASLVEVEYQAEEATTDFVANLPNGVPPKDGGETAAYTRGNTSESIGKADLIVDEVYTTPVQHHNPMEPHATIACWDGDTLLLYEPSQWIVYARTCAAALFGLPEQKVRVLGPYVGGGFGGKGALWSHSPLAIMVARMIGRPVKISLDRCQMYTVTGCRPRTVQKLNIAARNDGTLLSIQNHVVLHASPQVEVVEDSGTIAQYLYEVPAVSTSHRVVHLDVGPTSVMRAPGEATGNYALETAIDEVAFRLRMDPISLRLKNYAERDPKSGKPWSQKLLRECYAQGAARFGWSNRSPAPRSMRDGKKTVGFGVATASYPAYRDASSAVVRLRPDGSVYVASATHEIGTGTYTVLAQIASETLGIDLAKVEVKTGDTNLPPSIYSGGSLTVATVGSAVKAAAEEVKNRVIAMAIADSRSPLYRADASEITATSDHLVRPEGGQESYRSIFRRAGTGAIESMLEAKPDKSIDAFSTHSFGAVFAEVAVDPDFFTVQTRRLTAVYDVGRLINHKAGINQLAGGSVWGVSMALFEEAIWDTRMGRTVNADLAEYHLPVNADIGDLDISVLDIPDYRFNPLGARGIGELGITGAAAAVANAVFHATGKRVRDLPITVDKLLRAQELV
jgi:xanthine dehydrogenase YagR molybdenum-binding subunit